MRTTYRFDEIKRSRTVRTQCKDCKRKFQRTFTESQTLNPYNRDSEGFMKNAVQISNECAQAAKEKALAFEADPHCGCKQATP